MTVHVLHHGRALCGQPGTPNQWPPDHQWVFESNAHGLRPEIQCPVCFRALERKLAARPALKA